MQPGVGEGSQYHYEKIIFLDVDGVLHSDDPSSPADLFLPSCMMELQKICRTTGAQIVLSSSWRGTAHGRGAVNEQLARYNIQQFIDCTRIAGNEYARHTDVTEWVERNPTRAWVAIDDYPMPQLGLHYVQTNPETGLNPHSSNRAIQMLNMHSNPGYGSRRHGNNYN